MEGVNKADFLSYLMSHIHIHIRIHHIPRMLNSQTPTPTRQ